MIRKSRPAVGDDGGQFEVELLVRELAPDSVCPYDAEHASIETILDGNGLPGAEQG